MTDDQNSQKMLVDCTHIVDIPQLFACEITQSHEKITTLVTL